MVPLEACFSVVMAANILYMGLEKALRVFDVWNCGSIESFWCLGRFQVVSLPVDHLLCYSYFNCALHLSKQLAALKSCHLLFWVVNVNVTQNRTNARVTWIWRWIGLSTVRTECNAIYSFWLVGNHRWQCTRSCLCTHSRIVWRCSPASCGVTGTRNSVVGGFTNLTTHIHQIELIDPSSLSEIIVQTTTYSVPSSPAVIRETLKIKISPDSPIELWGLSYLNVTPPPDNNFVADSHVAHLTLTRGCCYSSSSDVCVA